MGNSNERLDNLSRYRVGTTAAWIAGKILRLCGWKAEGDLSEIRNGIVIVAHHTTNWDFVWGFLYSMQMQMQAYWVGKHSLFKGPFGGIMRWLGGISVNRSLTQNVVEQVVATFQKHKELILVVAPEGTRKRLDHWKTGFYHMARGAQVPIICGYIDYSSRRVGLGPVLMMTDDIELDFQRIRDFYDTVSGKFPEKHSDIRPRP